MNRELAEAYKRTTCGALRRLRKAFLRLARDLLKESHDMTKRAQRLPFWRLDKYLAIVVAFYVKLFALWLGGDAL